MTTNSSVVASSSRCYRQLKSQRNCDLNVYVLFFSGGMPHSMLRIECVARAASVSLNHSYRRCKVCIVVLTGLFNNVSEKKWVLQLFTLKLSDSYKNQSNKYSWVQTGKPFLIVRHSCLRVNSKPRYNCLCVNILNIQGISKFNLF